MTPSSHAAIKLLTPAELLADGCCRSVAAASEWSGLSLNTLHDLMGRGVLPWQRAGDRNRLIPRRALVILLEEVFAKPTPEKLPRPGKVRA